MHYTPFKDGCSLPCVSARGGTAAKADKGGMQHTDTAQPAGESENGARILAQERKAQARHLTAGQVKVDRLLA